METNGDHLAGQDVRAEADEGVPEVRTVPGETAGDRHAVGQRLTQGADEGGAIDLEAVAEDQDVTQVRGPELTTEFGSDALARRIVRHEGRDGAQRGRMKLEGDDRQALVKDGRAEDLAGRAAAGDDRRPGLADQVAQGAVGAGEDRRRTEIEDQLRPRGQVTERQRPPVGLGPLESVGLHRLSRVGAVKRGPGSGRGRRGPSRGERERPGPWGRSSGGHLQPCTKVPTFWPVTAF